jgi:hypothetical protein
MGDKSDEEIECIQRDFRLGCFRDWRFAANVTCPERGSNLFKRWFVSDSWFIGHSCSPSG